MRKITLNVDSLDVQTFETTGALRQFLGTVKANDSEPTDGGYEDTCGQSCTCFHRCYSNNPSCPACHVSDFGSCISDCGSCFTYCDDTCIC